MAATLINVSQWISGGSAKAQYAVSSSGRPYDSSSLTAGNSSGMTDIEGFASASISFPEARLLQIEGDDGVRGSIQFEGAELPSFEMAFADFTASFYNAVMGTITDDAQSIYDFMILNPGSRTFPDLFITLTRRSVSTEAGSEGSGYETLVFPLVTATFSGPGDFATGDNAGEYGYTMSVNTVSVLPWGESLSVANHGTTTASGFLFWSESIPTFDVFIQNNSDTTFTPAHSKASNAQVIAWDGASGGATSTLPVTYSTDDISFTAQTSGNITTALYERL